MGYWAYDVEWINLLDLEINEWITPIPVIIFFIVFIFMIDIIRDHWTTTKNKQYLLLMGINKINTKSVGQLPRLSKFQTVCFVLLNLLVIQICNKTCTPLALRNNRENDSNLIITSLVFFNFCTSFFGKEYSILQ